MSGFAGRAIAALIVMLGMALLDIGPRASASFWPALSSPQNSSTDAGGGSGSSDEKTEVVPTYSISTIVLAVLQNLNGVGQGGAGAPAPSSPSGVGPAPAIAFTGCIVIVTSDASNGLRLPEIRPGPSVLVTSIFEPPRVG